MWSDINYKDIMLITIDGGQDGQGRLDSQGSILLVTEGGFTMTLEDPGMKCEKFTCSLTRMGDKACKGDKIAIVEFKACAMLEDWATSFRG